MLFLVGVLFEWHFFIQKEGQGGGGRSLRGILVATDPRHPKSSKYLVSTVGVWNP